MAKERRPDFDMIAGKLVGTGQKLSRLGQHVSMSEAYQVCLMEILSTLRSYGETQPVLVADDRGLNLIDLKKPPITFWSIDPANGAPTYLPSWYVCVSFIRNNVPIWGAIAGSTGVIASDVLLITQRIKNNTRAVGLSLGRGETKSVFGEALIHEFGVLSAVPKAQAGVDFIQGRTKAWVAIDAYHYEVAAIAAIALKQAGVVMRHIGGEKIDWTARKTKLAPIVLAESEELAKRVDVIYKNAQK